MYMPQYKDCTRRKRAKFIIRISQVVEYKNALFINRYVHYQKSVYSKYQQYM